MQHDLDGLPPLPRMADKIDVTERFQYLDLASMAAREGSAALKLLGVDEYERIVKRPYFPPTWLVEGTWCSAWATSGAIGSPTPAASRPDSSGRTLIQTHLDALSQATPGRRLWLVLFRPPPAVGLGAKRQIYVALFRRG